MQGIDLYVLSRGKHRVPDGATALVADVADSSAVAAALGGMRFDAVVDFLCYEPGAAERAVATFSGWTEQYVFICSSASAYEKPPRSHVIDENTALRKPVLAIRPRQDRLRACLHGSLAEKRFPRDNRSSVPYLRQDAGFLRLSFHRTFQSPRGCSTAGRSSFPAMASLCLGPRRTRGILPSA
ncbi:MAG: hypothetical protein MZU95_10235 [Desulfomicrobium escambiense]|nr:hypothetical protein [Desulfomicrobium escambiense]